MAETVLLIEDEQSIGSLLHAYLGQSGFQVVWARTGEAGLAEMDRRAVRLVILDVGLPGMDGFEVCGRIRARSSVPVLMLTARDEEPDRVAGLEVGADDYVLKPFSPRELVARIRAILRRVDGRGQDDLLQVQDVVLRRSAREVQVGGALVELTAKEFDLLACLMEHPGVVLSRDRLLDQVWGLDYPAETRTVDVHVAQLRRKLDRPDLIRTVRGAGYKASR